VIGADGLMHAGEVRYGGRSLNLNRPGVIRALLDEAGWQAVELDGWDLFDVVAARSAPPQGG
jgi:hypothetical protein